jgi:hypothetical protein
MFHVRRGREGSGRPSELLFGQSSAAASANGHAIGRSVLSSAVPHNFGRLLLRVSELVGPRERGGELALRAGSPAAESSVLVVHLINSCTFT